MSHFDFAVHPQPRQIPAAFQVRLRVRAISGAGSGLDVMKPRHGFEPGTLFPHRLEAFFGFAVVDIEPATLTITFYDEHGSQREKPLTLMRRLR